MLADSSLDQDPLSEVVLELGYGDFVSAAARPTDIGTSSPLRFPKRARVYADHWRNHHVKYLMTRLLSGAVVRLSAWSLI